MERVRRALKNLITHEEVIRVVFHFVAVPRDADPHIVHALTTAVLHWPAQWPDKLATSDPTYAPADKTV